MADYKELLRRAITALPENNGAARRAVYEKARTALVGQLRAIQPPLPAREITQHRLQLEDCIRQVEQEASEAVIMLGRDTAPIPREPLIPVAPVPKPAPAPQAAAPVVTPQPQFTPPPKPVQVQAPMPVAAVPVEPEIDEPVPEPVSIEDIIGEAAEASGAAVEAVEPDLVTAEPLPPPVVAKPSQTPQRPDLRTVEPTPLKSPSFTARRDSPAPLAANSDFVAPASLPRIEPGLGATALARQPQVQPVAIEPVLPVEPALSSVREVDLEDDAREAEGVIERAIETLDREARGEATEALPDRSETRAAGALDGDASDDSGFATVGAEQRSGAGVTIFLVVFALLLVGVGGAGFWAWREGYVDLDQMFGRAQTTTTQTAQNVETPNTPSMDAMTTAPGTTGEEAVGPGNTATTVTQEPTNALEGLETEDRLEPTPEAVVPSGSETVLPSINSNGEAKTEERLSGQDTSIAATNDPSASVDPSVLAGSQSLLLEASTDGRGGAVPFSGTVDWSEGVDEIGLPTLVAEANIPARNLKVSLTIRKNSDPSLPASHLMEVTFDVSDTFIGGSISTLAGVLLKDEELVPGTALVGASARVVGNSFLFALSTSGDDVTNNTQLLSSRRWIDLAIVYGTGRNAILTLEKDDEAEALFQQAFAAWNP
ncbi:hypothetical protein [Devosia sp. 63-57]|uniref:hypothetical protein n=1 Tax=Devosia sp. 63-57 TaxID=1895751 RepID=UPI00086CAFA1|nr:hypothetical protein [Devosia sp. 63-57]ODT48912.1 MAG: hypothetical protein ABS74_10460 [Pelagibacterium sp. SCN 63-126]ODU89305.1 MAG: hypothetical protein ABT14_00190 [Pelagibacterium sp. SCN 63-17]OJX44158.1 MAG: hypothetical protein BGO80_00750 [Devosia sp. 63-57]